MKYPEEFTKEKLSKSCTIMLLPDGNEVSPYIEYFVNKFKFLYYAPTIEHSLLFNKISKKTLLVLSLSKERVKIIEIKKITDIADIEAYLTVYDAKKITRMLKIKSLFEK